MMYYIARGRGEYIRPFIFLIITISYLAYALDQSWPWEFWIPAIGIAVLFWIPTILELMTTVSLYVEGRKFRIYIHRRLSETRETEDYMLDNYEGIAPVGFYFPEARLMFRNGLSRNVSIPYSQALIIDRILSQEKTRNTVVGRTSLK